MLFLENVSIKIWPTGKKPLKSYVDSAGFDLYAGETVLVLPKNQIGLSMQIPLIKKILLKKKHVLLK